MPEFTHSKHVQGPPKPGARLLPWSDPEGRPAYIVSGDSNGPISRLADSMEEAHLHDAAVVLDHSLSVLHNADASEAESRFVAERLAECLKNALRVALSRGERLTPDDGEGELLADRVRAV